MYGGRSATHAASRLGAAAPTGLAIQAYLRSVLLPQGGPYFSISHCKEAIAVAIDAHPIGIDIESIRHADDDLIARTMNEAEQSKIKNQKSKIEGDREFTRLWTQKEAVAKMNGTGIEGFEQLQHILSKSRDLEISTIEKEKYIYTIAYGKLCSIGAEIQAADL